MREIKFRAFYKPKKIMCDVIQVDFGSDNYYLVNPKKQREDFLCTYDKIEIMQFTGLYDKNGKEIFEGDVLKGNFHIPIQVYFSDGQFKANVIGKDKQGELTWHGHLLGRTEVIGNIYENPELLEQ